MESELKIQCKRCRKVKPISEFHKNKRSLYGVKKICRECCSIYRREHYIKNINRIRDYCEVNKGHFKEYRRDLLKRFPWYRHWAAAYSRCNNESHRSYKWYGARGIKMLLTFDEVARLWSRDKAYLMKKPSIDRINNDDSYVFGNCHFIELDENRKKGSKTTVVIM